MEATGKPSLNFPNVHAFPHPGHYQLVSAFGVLHRADGCQTMPVSVSHRTADFPLKVSSFLIVDLTACVECDFPADDL